MRSNSVRVATLVTLSIATSIVGAHTLFLKPDSFHLGEGATVNIPLLNGTFTKNENKISSSRIVDAVVVAPSGLRQEISSNAWSIGEDEITVLTKTFDDPGNYVVGLGTKPLMARIEPENFNFYLEYEGLVDDASERARLEETETAAAEKYSKFAKAILQVGDGTSDNYDIVLGHRVEVVPLVNPYVLSVGDTFRARVLKDGDPLVGELVYATHEGHYEPDDRGIYDELVSLRSDENGEVAFKISERGRWYVRFIELTRSGDSEHWYSGILVRLGAEEPRIPYESLWATLTFEIR